jgi:crossover junction endodeoxyribonuclease RuvC
MRILGLDLSLNGPGFCPLPNVTHSLTMTTKDGDRRYVRIRDAIEHYVTQEIEQRPQVVYSRGYSLAVIESVPTYSTGTSSLERVHGVAREALARYGVPFAYVSPSALKSYATNDGSAEKQAMIDALPADVRAQCANDNEADAWWLADMGRMACGDQLDWARLPEHQVAALSRVPDLMAFAHGADGRKVRIEKCGHGYQCLVNAGRMLHPLLLDPCDKPAKPKNRTRK